MKNITSLLFGCLLLFSCQIEEINKADNPNEGTFSKSSIESETASCTNSLNLIASSLPETVDFCTTGQGPDAYLNINITEGFLAGSYGSWCIDDDLAIAPTQCYVDAAVFLSTGDLPADAFEHPENFDSVNWLLNQNIVGSESPVSSEIYTYGDLQFAIWKLLDDLRDPSEACTDCGLDDDWSAVRAGELVSDALAEGDGFTPGCNEFVGIILRPDGVQPLIIPFKIVGEECSPCDGKVTELSLKYNGDITDAHIVVSQKKDGEVVFDGTVQPGETFSFVGIDKKNTLGTEITVTINGEVNTKIHTSCSQPIGPGLIFGDFVVIAGASRNGGALCPLDPPPGGGDDCGECEGKVTNLTMQNNGPDGLIRVEQKKNGEVVFEGDVSSGASFSFSGMDKNGTLGTEIIIYIDDTEHTRIHTSCSKPIGPGLVSGNFEVIDGASRNGGELCPVETPPGGGDDCGECEGKITNLTMQNNGPDGFVRVEQKKDGEVVFEGDVASGASFSFSGMDKNGTLGTEIIIYIDDTEHTRIHTSCSKPIGPGLVSGNFEVLGGASRNGGKLCPVESPPGGADDCGECEGKVTRLDLVYNGTTTADITVKDKKGENEITIGTVNPGDTFTIDGAGGVFDDKKGTLGTEISIHIDGSENTKIHTSCSQPIESGLTFGDFTVIGGASREGGEFCGGPI